MVQETEESKRRMEEERLKAEKLSEQRRLREEREAATLLARAHQVEPPSLSGQMAPSQVLPPTRSPISRISVGRKCWAVLADESIVYWNADSRQWSSVPGRVVAISAAKSDDTVWSVDKLSNVWALQHG